MVETADVVIGGGGIVGSSIAYHPAEQNYTNVVVIEREERQGLGSTSKSAGGVRAQFATPINIQMSLYSIDFFSRFEEATGHTADYQPFGYLFVATNEKHLTYLESPASAISSGSRARIRFNLRSSASFISFNVARGRLDAPFLHPAQHFLGQLLPFPAEIWSGYLSLLLLSVTPPISTTFSPAQKMTDTPRKKIA